MKRSSCILLMLSMFCILIFSGAFALRYISSQAEAIFGPPSSNLNFSQKILLSWQLLHDEAMLTSPLDNMGSEVSFHINLGETPTSVANRLEEEGIISNAEAFRNFLIYTGLDTQIQAGVYSLSPATSTIQIAYTLLDATPSEVPFAVLAGWRIEEIAESLPSSGLRISPEVFITEAQGRNLEGFLFPGIYIVSRTISTAALLDVLETAFYNALSSEIKAGFSKQGLTLNEGVILASIVEREAIVDSEKPSIASVFLNRLAIGMKLEADPTVQYSIGFNKTQDTWWTNPLSATDLRVNSKFNTYLYTGLPPGAICNPSLESLKAVALPAQTPYYYFRATCDGSGHHSFAETYDEHLGNACR